MGRVSGLAGLVDGVRWHLGILRTSPANGASAVAGRRLAVFPAADANMASTRLRALPLLDLLDPGSVRSGGRSAPLLRSPPDIAWIQKRVTRGHLRVARAVKERGGMVVYDCDESGPELDPWVRRDRVADMLVLADVVTTDTPERAEQLREVVSSCRPQVIENGVDYGDHLPAPPRRPSTGDEVGLRVLWFGSDGNLRFLAPWVDVILSLPGVDLVVCGPRRSEIRRTLGRVPLEVRSWSRSGFPRVLTGCHVTVLSHFGSRFDEAKSAHKMVTSIGHGVPALVSATPDHERVAAFAGITDTAVFRTREELRDGLERMRSGEARRTMLDRAMGLLLGRYGPGCLPAAAARLLRA
jgi:hypothetical protein